MRSERGKAFSREEHPGRPMLPPAGHTVGQNVRGRKGHGLKQSGGAHASSRHRGQIMRETKRQ